MWRERRGEREKRKMGKRGKAKRDGERERNRQDVGEEEIERRSCRKSITVPMRRYGNRSILHEVDSFEVFF
jgi:hypothetical protein